MLKKVIILSKLVMRGKVTGSHAAGVVLKFGLGWVVPDEGRAVLKAIGKAHRETEQAAQRQAEGK